MTISSRRGAIHKLLDRVFAVDPDSLEDLEKELDADEEETKEERVSTLKAEDDGRITVTTRIVKTDATRQIAYGVVLEPGDPDNRDAHGHYVTKEDIYDAMVRYGMKSFKPMTDQHRDLAEGVRIIEMAQAPVDFEWEGPNGVQVVKAGTWYMGTYYPEPLWSQILKGEKTGLSFGGTGRVIPG